MDRNRIIFMIFSGLCILPPCFAEFAEYYHYLIEDKMTWSDARSYCRDKYTDLVTIKSGEDMVKLSSMLMGMSEAVWIGLFGDLNNWKWSLERAGFYKEGEADFTNWQPSQPNAFSGPPVCANIGTDGKWSDQFCSVPLKFVCYNGTGYINVETTMSWPNAQKFCREHYIDLASIRNSTENEEVQMVVTYNAWIGLYRAAWKWSNGQLMDITSFTSWDNGEPGSIRSHCVTSTGSKWTAQPCDSQYAFVCSEHRARKHVVKVMLRKSDSSADLEQMQEAILQQFTQRLKDHIQDEDLKVKWTTQPDGSTFHLKDARKKNRTMEDKQCILKQ